MASSTEMILAAISKRPGITDRWLAETIYGPGTRQQRVNGPCRDLAAKALIVRTKRPDGLIGNFIAAAHVGVPDKVVTSTAPDQDTLMATNEPFLSEDGLKTILKSWLSDQGWVVEVAWARTPGIDLHARRNSERWIIEAKGQGSRAPMRVNYFLGALGETLQRMNEPDARYSVAFPDLRQFRSLWSRLPNLAKERTQISALFVKNDGTVEEVR